MKITGVDIYLAREWRTFLFVVVRTDEGIDGVGEAGITSRELATKGMLEHLSPQLIGRNPFDTEDIWQTLYRGAFFPSGQILTTAIAAIDMALWDIKGKALGVPVYQLIGGLARQKVLTYNHLHGETKEALLEHAQASVAEGWRCLRFEPPYDPNHVWNAARSISESIERWQLLRENLGDEVELCFDAHTRFNLAEAAQFCRAVEPLRPLFIEDALRSELNQSYHGLRQQTSVPLAAGEQFGTKWDFKYLVENELINMARIDLCIAGGLTESLKIAHLCEAHGVDIAVHNPLGPVSTAVCLHLNLAISNMAVQELPRRPGECMADAVESHIEWQDGYLLPPSAPGLGVTLNVQALANYPFTPEELPRLHRGDGSFQNW